jgi:hypothetical protein
VGLGDCAQAVRAWCEKHRVFRVNKNVFFRENTLEFPTIQDSGTRR